MSRDRGLVATYRLQLTPAFGFDDVVERMADIERLGASHLYLSPITEAIPGSPHGYDVVDHSQVRAEFGGREGLDRLLVAADEHGLGVVVDHVPNHVSVERAELNPPWWATLRGGPAEPAARWFDIEWDVTGGKVIVAKLARPLDEAIDAGELATGVGDRGPEITYGPLRFPMAPGTEELGLRDALEQQHYRLSWWRDPARNVRRFFTIDDLVAVRVEEPDVAAAVDTLPERLTASPAFAGVRVDHVDGLSDPGGYLTRLRERIGDRWLVVEKILGPGESLPTSWPVDGTTGYEHITATEHTLLDPHAEQHLTPAWERLSGDESFEEVEATARREVMDDGLRPDVDRLVREVTASDDAVADDDRMRSAVVELTLALDRYRTYLPGDPGSADVLADAHDRAVERLGERTEVDRLVPLVAEGAPAGLRWQQLTGPVMAKGAEDRAFYRWCALASLSEVGGRPGVFSTDVDAFHEHQLDRQARHPQAMLAETTHDTKRSAGVRARSLALAARSESWVKVATDWLAGHRDLVDGLDGAVVSLALQTAVTARPLTSDRLSDYLVKAAREADRVTSWTQPDDAVESAIRRLAGALVTDTSSPSDTSDTESGDATSLAAVADEIEAAGSVIGLRMLVLHLTCPGVPDLYQGSPRALLSLVDPDNRTPPDWAELHDLLERVETSDTAQASSDGDTDLARTILTERILRLRRRRPDAFGPSAGYVVVPLSGNGSEHVVAFARSRDDVPGDEPLVVAVVERALSGSVALDAVEVTLPDGAWRNILHDDARIATGGPTRLRDLTGSLGVAVLDRTDR